MTFQEKVLNELNKEKGTILIEKVQDFTEETILYLEGEISDREVKSLPGLQRQLKVAERTLAKCKKTEETVKITIMNSNDNILSPETYLTNRVNAITATQSAQLNIDAIKADIKVIEDEIKILKGFLKDLK